MLPGAGARTRRAARDRETGPLRTIDGTFNFISILLSEMPFEAVAFGKRLSGISGTAARRRMEAKSRSNRPRSLRLFSINSDAASCGRAPDCKIDGARKIHRCRSRLPYTAQW